MGIKCKCGLEHGDGRALRKIGWQVDGAGGALLLANCGCGSTLTIASLEDVSLCATCHRAVVGDAADFKVCVVDSDGASPRVLCFGCYRRDVWQPAVRRWSGVQRVPTTLGEWRRGQGRCGK